jgi:hypothetical protein
MTRAPSLAAVYAAELKFAQSAQNTVNGVRRTRDAVRAVLARPSTLAWVAGAAALSGFLVSRRRTPLVQISGRRRVEKEPKLSFMGVVMALVMRQALARLPGILEQLWAARRQSEVPPDAVTSPQLQAVAHPPERVLH